MTVGALILMLVGQSLANSQPSTDGETNAIRSMAVLGDSISTGAATHPSLKYSSQVLWDLFRGQVDNTPKVEHIPEVHYTDLTPPQVLPPATREYQHHLQWFYINVAHQVASTFLNTAVYSWAYLTARELGVQPDQMYFAASNGARVKDIPRQMDRLLDLLDGHLPDATFLFYTGNDLCGPTVNNITQKEQFEESLTSGLRYILRNTKPSNIQPTVYVVGFLGVPYILHVDSVLNHQIENNGKPMTCRELREVSYLPKDRPMTSDSSGDGPPEIFAAFFPPNPMLACPTLLASGKEGEKTRQLLANRVRTFREIERKIVAQLNKEAEQSNKSIRFGYLGSTEKLIFDGPEMAEDCFHLSVKGQKKIANAIVEELTTTQ